MIETYGASFDRFKFPCGDLHVTVRPDDFGSGDDNSVWIKFEFEKAEEIIELMLLCDALRRDGRKVTTLEIPYVPFSRQDRVVNKGEPLSIKVFADLINSLKIPKVLIADPHSDVTTALIDNVEVLHQHDVFGPVLLNKYPQRDFVLVSPDSGASKKIYKLLQYVEPLQILECSKIRDTKTGEITGASLPDLGAHTFETAFGDVDFVIVDDICDGGQTFIKLAKKLRSAGAHHIVLMVTHGFFTKGLKVFDGIIDEIHTREGQVK